MTELVDYLIAESVGALGGQIRQPTVLAPTPHQFVRVKLRCVRGQRLGHDFGVGRQEVLHAFGPLMNATAVPQNRECSAAPTCAAPSASACNRIRPGTPDERPVAGPPQQSPER